MSTQRKPIKTSDMRIPVNIQKQQNVKDDSGGVKRGWVTLWPDVFVKITSRMVGSFSAGGELETAIRYQLTTRYFDGVNSVVPGMRIDDYTHGRFLNVVGVNDPNGDGEQMDIHCTEVQ